MRESISGSPSRQMTFSKMQCKMPHIIAIHSLIHSTTIELPVCANTETVLVIQADKNPWPPGLHFIKVHNRETAATKEVFTFLSNRNDSFHITHFR